MAKKACVLTLLTSALMAGVTELVVASFRDETDVGLSVPKLGLIFSWIALPVLMMFAMGSARPRSYLATLMFHWICWSLFGVYLCLAAFNWHPGWAKDLDLTLSNVLRHYFFAVVMLGGPFSLGSSGLSYLIGPRGIRASTGSSPP